MLIDGGSTHNFIQEKLVFLGLLSSKSNDFHVMVGNGEQLSGNSVCSHIPLSLDDNQFYVDFYVLPLSGANVVLGIRRFTTLGPVLTGYSELIMTFTWNGQEEN